MNSKKNFRRCFFIYALVLALVRFPFLLEAQVNSGSTGADGAFNPTANTVINMADHPDGIYQFTSVKIPSGVMVSFIPNSANTPVVWLVQGNCVINGIVDIGGKDGAGIQGGPAGVGGFPGGNGGGGGAPPGDGQGPGGGPAGYANSTLAGNASFATNGAAPWTNYLNGCGISLNQPTAGERYGNHLLLPLIGGSGGGGTVEIRQTGLGYGGGGGGGAIMIAANQFIEINGRIACIGGSGGNSGDVRRYGGGGSGGAIRIVSQEVRGTGQLDVSEGRAFYNCGFGYDYPSPASPGFIRFDSFVNVFAGTANGVVTRGFQSVIIPPANQAVSLAIQSVAGFAVAISPTGSPIAPDVSVPGNQQNPVAIVVRCGNIQLNTEIIVEIKPANGPTVRAVGMNNQGTKASSTATVTVNMPRGGGTIQAKAVSGIAGSLGASLNNGEKFRQYAQTGLTTDAELFAKMEITATLGHGQEIAYITQSGKRFVLQRN